MEQAKHKFNLVDHIEVWNKKETPRDFIKILRGSSLI